MNFMGIRALALLCLALAFSGHANPVDELPPWEFPQAHTRLITSPVLSQTHTLRVDIPAALQARTGSFRVVDKHGVWMGGFPVLEDGRLIAVEVRVIVPMETATTDAESEQEVETETVAPDDDDERGQGPRRQLRQPRVYSDPFSIQVYLFEAKMSAPARYRRTPVSLYVGPGIGVARPGTGEGFLSMYSKLQPLHFRGEVPNLSNDGTLDRLPYYVPRRQKLVYRLSTLWYCKSPRELQFGVLNDDNGAWYLFINREPVFSWTEAVRDHRQRQVSKTRVVAAGLHRLDFFGVMVADERPPALAYRDVASDDQFQRFAEAELWSANGIDEVIVEGKGDMLVQGFDATLEQTYLFTDVDHVLQRLVVQDLTANLLGLPLRQQSLMVDGKPIVLDASGRGTAYRAVDVEATLSLSHADTLGFTQSFELPVRMPWPVPRRVGMTFNALSLPHVEPQYGSPVLDYHLQASALFRGQLLADAELVVRSFSGGNRLLDEHRGPIPPSPFRRQVPIAMENPRTARVEVGIEVGGVAVVAPIKVYLLRPDDEIAFRMSAGMLRYRDGIAIIRRGLRLASVKGVDLRVQQAVVVDGFMTQAGHVRDVLLPEQWGDVQDRLAVHLVTLNGPGLDASFPPFAKFAAMRRILRREAEAVVWAVGKSEIAHGMTVDEYRTELSYLVQATLHAGKMPVLVTMPIVGELTQERLRLYALAVMELAAEFQVPVVDLYSASLLRRNIDAFYRIDGRGELLSSTPDAKGRAWLFQHITATIMQYNHERKSE